MYVALSGQAFRDSDVTRELLTHDAEAYGAIAINYATGRYFEDHFAREYGAFQYAKFAAHVANRLLASNLL